MVRKLSLAFGLLLFAGTAFAYTPPQTCPAHNWFSAFDPIKPLTCTQPSFSDLLGTLGAGQFTATTCTNQVITALSNSGAGTCSTVANADLAGPLVSGVTIGAGGDFTLSKTDPLAVGNETLTPGTVNKLNGAVGTAGQLWGSTGTALENETVSGDCAFTRAGANSYTITCTKINGATPVTSIAGTTNQIAASASTGAVTLSLAGPHNYTTETAHGVLLGQGTTAVTATGTQTAGQALVGQGATSDPLWKSISGDVSLASSGAATVGSVSGTPASQLYFSTTAGATIRGTKFIGLAAGGTISLGGSGDMEILDVIARNANMDGNCRWYMEAAGVAVTELDSASPQCGISSGASRLNLFVSGGNWTLQNNTANALDGSYWLYQN